MNFTTLFADMGRANISYLSAAAALLLAGAKGQLQPQGCASLDVTAAADSNALEPNSSELCADYCNSNGYPYIALFLQYVHLPSFPRNAGTNPASLQILHLLGNCTAGYKYILGCWELGLLL